MNASFVPWIQHPNTKQATTHLVLFGGEFYDQEADRTRVYPDLYLYDTARRIWYAIRPTAVMGLGFGSGSGSGSVSCCGDGGDLNLFTLTLTLTLTPYPLLIIIPLP